MIPLVGDVMGDVILLFRPSRSAVITYVFIYMQAPTVIVDLLHVLLSESSPFKHMIK